MAVWWIRATAEHSTWRWRDLFDQHVPGEPCLFGMGSALSKKCAREARPGDLAVCYMGGEGYREVECLAVIAAGDLRDDRGRPAVDLRPGVWLRNPVPRAALVNHRALRAALFFRIRLGTMFPVSAAEWRAVRAVIAAANRGTAARIASLERGRGAR